MDLHPSVAERLAGLAPDQRAAATAPPGPSLCIAPAGSGKTTTLVARAAWLVATGTPPERIRAITFNKRAAVEMTERLDAAVAPLGVEPGAVRVRTFHALGREILRDAGVAVDPLADRAAILAEVAPWADDADLLRLDTFISRLKVELGVDAATVAADPEAGRMARAFVDYEAAVRATGGLDFDDLILRVDRVPRGRGGVAGSMARTMRGAPRGRGPGRRPGAAPSRPAPRRSRRTGSSWSATTTSRSTAGVSPTSGGSWGWRPCCPDCGAWTSRSTTGVRGASSSERCGLSSTTASDSRRRSGPRPEAAGRLVLAPDASDETVRIERVVRSWPDDGSTRAILARTNRELLPAVVVALRLGLSFRAPRIDLLVESPLVDDLIARIAADGRDHEPLLIRIGTVHAAGTVPAVQEIATALLGWAVGFDSLASFSRAITATRARIADLRRDDAPLTLATAHATKGLEFDHVVVIGMEVGRFPSARAVSQAEDPVRAYEEERRLGYVAWTRARRSLTLAYDPTVPSPFLLEAFSEAELGLDRTMTR